MWNSIRNTVTGLLDEETAVQSPQIRKATDVLEPPSKKTDLKASPGKSGNATGRLVNMTPVNLNKKSLAKTSNSNASVQSNLSKKKTEDFMQQRDHYRSMALARRMKVTTHDMHIHALAMLFSCDLDFDLFPLTVRDQMLLDIQAIISSPMFDSSPFYRQYNLDIVLQILSIEETTENKSKAELIHLSKIVVQAVINKYMQPVADIAPTVWNHLCNMLGVFVPKNGFPAYYKKVFLVELYEKIEAYLGMQNTFVNMHALGHIAFYFGERLRPIANQSKDNIIPPFFTDISFSLDTRRALLQAAHKEFKNPGNPLRRSCGSPEWCGSGDKCQVDLWPATDQHKCSKCHHNIHPQCAFFTSSTFNCQVCMPEPLRRHWTQRKRTYMLLPHLADQDTTANTISATNDMNANTKGTTDTSGMEVQATNATDADAHAESNEMAVDSTADEEGKENSLQSEDIEEVNEDDGREEEELQDTKSARALLMSQLGMGMEAATTGNSLENLETEYKDLEYNTRWDLIFTLPTTREATDELSLLVMFKGFINALKLTDVNAVVIPWYNSSQSGNLSIDNLLPDLDAIQIYFPRARVNPDNVKVYTDVRIAHSIPRASLEIGIRTWLINSKSSLYYKKLQVENTRVVGWFMWSHRYIKSDLLAHVLAEEHSIHGFFRFSTIYLGKGEKFGPKEGTKALFFVCEAKDFVDTTAELRILYHQGQTNFPMGIRLRFMPQIQNIDENLLLKMQIFRVQQFDFNIHIKTAGTSDIQLLDAAIQGSKPLRNFIMNLKHNTSKDPLFLSVDTQWNDPSRCVFAFVLCHEKEAIRMVNTLAAHVLAKNPARAKACFTPKAIELAATFQWDATRICYMTSEELYYMEMVIWGNDTTLMGVDKDLVEKAILAEKNAKLTANVTEKPAARIERLYNGTDACSVGTVASRKHSKRITGEIDTDTDAASLGGDSISTNATTKSRRQAQDSKLVILEANMQQTQRTLIDMSILLETLTNQIQGKAAVTPLDTSKHITINDSSAESKAAPRAGSRKASGGRK